MLSNQGELMRMYKGQYFSFDAIIATVIFILALLALLSYWQSLRTSLDVQSGDLTKEAIRISDALLTPGYLPSGQNPADCAAMAQLGFAVSWEDRRLDRDKIECAISLAPEDVRSKLATPYFMTAEVTLQETDPLSREAVVLRVGENIQSINRNNRNIARVRRVITVIKPAVSGAYDEIDREQLAVMDVFVYQ